MQSFFLVLTEVLLYVILLDKVFSQQVSDQSALSNNAAAMPVTAWCESDRVTHPPV